VPFQPFKNAGLTLCSFVCLWQFWYRGRFVARNRVHLPIVDSSVFERTFLQPRVQRLGAVAMRGVPLRDPFVVSSSTLAVVLVSLFKHRQ